MMTRTIRTLPQRDQLAITVINSNREQLKSAQSVHFYVTTYEYIRITLPPAAPYHSSPRVSNLMSQSKALPVVPANNYGPMPIASSTPPRTIGRTKAVCVSIWHIIILMKVYSQSNELGYSIVDGAGTPQRCVAPLPLYNM